VDYGSDCNIGVCTQCRLGIIAEIYIVRSVLNLNGLYYLPFTPTLSLDYIVKRFSDYDISTIDK
jgi:hypothetical protein